MGHPVVQQLREVVGDLATLPDGIGDKERIDAIAELDRVQAAAAAAQQVLMVRSPPPKKPTNAATEFQSPGSGAVSRTRSGWPARCLRRWRRGSCVTPRR